MNKMSREFILASAALALLASASCREDDDVCEEAQALCGAAGSFDDECVGSVRSYAACIVDRGDCGPQTLVDCAASGLPDGGGGSGVVEICARYLECAARVTPAALPGLQEGYGPNGTCWASGSVSLCEEACRRGLSQLRLVASDEPACGCREDSECLETGKRHCDMMTGMCGECGRSADCGQAPLACVRSSAGPTCATCEDTLDYDGQPCGFSKLAGAEIWSAAPLCLAVGGAPTCIGCISDADCRTSACDPATHRCAAAGASCLGIWECMRYAPVDCALGASCCDQPRCPQSSGYTTCMMRHCLDCGGYDDCLSCSIANCKPEYQACDTTCS